MRKCSLSPFTSVHVDCLTFSKTRKCDSVVVVEVLFAENGGNQGIELFTKEKANRAINYGKVGLVVGGIYDQESLSEEEI